MKLEQNTKFKNFNTSETIEMGLDLDNTHGLMNLLRNNIYSDPITSFVREVYSNAIDAQARVNCQEPIEVSFEKWEGVEEQLFCVRDYGASMTKDTIANIYSKMGRSDKRSGNSEMGGWGLGAKSPLAYTTHFWIETWTEEDGKLIYRKWVQYIDASRVGAIGLEQERDAESHSKTGTKVSVPFKSTDREVIIKAASLYINYSRKSTSVSGFELKPHQFNYDFIAKDWALHIPKPSVWNSNQTKTITVGNIPYPLNMEILNDNFKAELNTIIKPSSKFHAKYFNHFRDFITTLKDYGLRLDLPVGSLDLSASREEVQYTPKTVRNIWLALYQMFEEYLSIVKIDLLYHPDYPKACKYYQSNYKSSLYFIEDLIRWEVIEDRPAFEGRESLFPNQDEEGENLAFNNMIESFKLNTRGWGDDQKEIIERANINTIRLGHTYPVVIIQDTEYVRYQQFIKHYAQKQEQDIKFHTIYYVTSPESEKYLRPWIKQYVTILKMSVLVEQKKTEAPVIKKTSSSNTNTLQTTQSEFKSYVYVGYAERERADGLGFMFKNSSALKEPEETLYYINEETINNGISWPSNRTAITKYLNKYLSNKQICYSDLFYTKTKTRNFDHENWVDLADVIKQDLRKFKTNLDFLFEHYARVMAIQSQYKTLINIPSDFLLNKEGRFIYEQNKYQQSLNIFRNFLEGYNLLLMTDEAYRHIDYLSSVRYRSFDIDDLNSSNLSSLPKKYLIILRDTLTYYEEYFDQYPLLIQLNKDNEYRAGTDYTDYICLMEESLSEDKGFQLKEIKVEAPINLRTFSNLVSKFEVPLG